MPRPHSFECSAQSVDVFDEEAVSSAFGQVDREEPGCAGDMSAAIVSHGLAGSG
jgi:hypothetical protein